MYGWLYNTFGNNTFTIDDFRMIFPSPQPTKIIHDLIKLDFMKRTKRGKYRIIKPEEFVKKIIKENLEKHNILQKSNKKYAYANSTAVNIWTDGYYWTDFTRGFKPVHIYILKKDINYWKEFFNQHDVEYVLEGEHKTLFGLTYVLHPKETFTVETKDGNAVVPLKEIITYCQNNIILYRPALEYLDKKYHLHIFDNYEQVAS
jgi:sugar-specific transcriptional regulator TrmB